MCAADGHDLHRVEEVLVAAAADANDDQNQKARSSELPCGQMQHGHYEWRFALKRSVSVCVCVFVCLFVCLCVCVFVCEIAAGTSQESSSSDNEGDQMERQRTDLTETI